MTSPEERAAQKAVTVSSGPGLPAVPVLVPVSVFAAVFVSAGSMPDFLVSVEVEVEVLSPPQPGSHEQRRAEQRQRQRH